MNAENDIPLNFTPPGVIPPEDFAALIDMGVAAIFTPGTAVPDAAITVLERLNESLGYAQEQAAQ